MYSSVIYGDLALKNSAQSIEKDNAQFTSMVENMEHSISYQLSMADKKFIDRSFLIGFLQDFSSQNDEVTGAFMELDAEFLNTQDKLSLMKSGKQHEDFTLYISGAETYPFNNYKNKEYYLKPKETLKSFISNPYFRKIGNEEQKVYSIAYPILVDEKFVGIIGCDVDIEAIYRQLEGVSIYDGKASVALLDNTGAYLTHSFNPELIGKTLAEDTMDPEARLKNLRAGKVDNWFEGFVGSITNPIYFNDHQIPWQLQSRVHAKHVFKNVITAAYWIIPTIILTILFFVFRMRYFIGKRTEPLRRLDKISARIAEGDLTQNIDIQSNDEVGNLAGSFSKMVEKIRVFVNEIQQGSANITSASQQLSSSSQSLSSSTNEQASTGEEVSSNMDEMTASVQQNANKSAEIKSSSEKMMHQFNSLNKDAQKAAEMQEEIAKLSGMINDIAQNIKILSLNAAVEAARAGEHGKGFAVVAREVQKLSESTTASANQITERITASSQMSRKTMEFIKEIVPQLSALNEDIEEINMASQEQSTNIQMVTQATQQFNENTQENAASAEELASTAEELSNQADVLKEMSKQFKID